MLLESPRKTDFQTPNFIKLSVLGSLRVKALFLFKDVIAALLLRQLDLQKKPMKSSSAALKKGI